MLLSLLNGGDLTDIVVSLLLSVPIIIIALVFHETAHGYVAWKCGDNTASNLGRLTLDPRKHLDPMGLIAMLIFGYGWAKPVPVNTRNFRNPKRGMALTAAAGPAANLILGVISALFGGFFMALYNYLYFKTGGFIMTCVYWLTYMCELSAVYNFLFMVFNLIPIPPFDGSRIAFVFLPQKYYFGIMRYERQIMLGLLIALLVLDRFYFSPFSLIANKLTYLIVDPVFDFFWDVFRNALLK